MGSHVLRSTAAWRVSGSDIMRLASLTMRLLAIIASALIAPHAWRGGLYASFCLALLVLAAAVFSIMHHLVGLERRLRHREVAPVRPADQERLRNRVLLDHVPVPLLFLSVRGQIHAANRAARRLFSAEDRLIQPPEALLEALANPGSAREAEIIRITPQGDGPYRQFRLSTSQGASLGGVVTYIALIDIEAQLNTSTAETLRNLLQILGHEIMNSLTPVISLSAIAEDLCKEPLDRDNRLMMSEAIATIRRRAEGLEDFVSRYRELARLPPPVPESVMLARLLDETARLFAARYGTRLAFIYEAPSNHITVMLDRGQIELALMNLLINAAEAVAGKPEPRVRLSTRVEHGQITISVADNGVGIPEALRDSIFDPFTSFKEGGSGIGLSLTRQIINAHGGTLWVEPSDGEPWVTSFHMRF